MGGRVDGKPNNGMATATPAQTSRLTGVRDPLGLTSRRTLIIGVLVAGAVVRLVFAGLIPLFGDEAYYWEWSRRLAAGYFDHPPGIPILIRGGTALLGTTALGVRLLPVLAGFVAALACAGIARQIGDEDSALRGAAIITCMPLAAAGLVLATPDSPLLATSAVGMYTLVRALQAPRASRASLGWWIATGIALGFAFSSKYTSILMPIGVTLAVLSRASLRQRLRDSGPYVACVVATIVFLPVLLWNASHEWASFGFQIHHGLAAPTHRDVFAPLKRLGDMIGGQAGLVSPILFVLLGLAVVRGLRRSVSDVTYVLAVVTAFTFLFFCYSATRQRVEANWPAPAYIAAIPLLAALPMSPVLVKWFRAGLWLAMAVSALVYLHAAFEILPIPPRKDPVARSAGWHELAAAASLIAQQTASGSRGRTWLAADRYMDAAELAFYTPNHVTTFSLNLGGRSNQYDLWPGFAETARAGDNLVVALDETVDTHPIVAQLAPFFRTIGRDSLVDMRNRHGLVTQRRLWILRGWTGGWPARR
ncbi:MAG TPA: glycosyltransferase family 39 protein [Gemmatimonadaceae bacterium]